MRNYVVVLLLGYLILLSCRKDKAEPNTVKNAIAFLLKNKDSATHLWYVATDGSSYTQVLEDDIVENLNNPTWSADGRSIFFIKKSKNPGENGVYSVKPNGADFRKVYTDNATQTRNYYQLSASADDEHVVFSLDIPRSNRKVIELYRMCPCGERVERLTSFETSQTSLISTESYAGSFFPGDTTMLFSQSDPNITGRKDVRIYFLNLKTRATKLVTTVKAIDVAGTTPDVSPDGKRVLLSIDGVVHIMNADGTGLRTVGNVKGFRPTWDRNGRDFYFSSFNIPGMQPGIYKSNITLTDIVKISKNSTGQFGGISLN
jgi:Tol biopolymer transport system component